jgi:hypothetical protein
LHSGEEDIKEVAINHFKGFYKEQAAPTTNNQVRVVALFSKLVNDAEAEALFKPIDKNELKDFLSKFKVDKSLGPDG